MNGLNYKIVDKLNINSNLINKYYKNNQNDEIINNFKSENNYDDSMNKNRIKNGTILTKIDNIYSIIKYVPKYFYQLKILLFLLTVFNIMFIWIIIILVGAWFGRNEYLSSQRFFD